MRVIAGSARGVPLKGPPGPETRPTSDKVRGAIFDALAAELADARVLDLYAGTGALGIEALSRGAASCLFVERASTVCRVITANLRAARLQDRAHVWCIAASAALQRLDSPLSRAQGEGDTGVRASIPSTFSPPYDVIVLDPPYGDTEILDLIGGIGRSRLVARGGLVVLEHGKRVQPPSEPGTLRLRRTRRYGDTVVTLWQNEEDADS